MKGFKDYGRKVVRKNYVWTCAKCGHLNCPELNKCSKCTIIPINFSSGMYRTCERCLSNKHISNFKKTGIQIKGYPTRFKNCKDCCKNIGVNENE